MLKINTDSKMISMPERTAWSTTYSMIFTLLYLLQVSQGTRCYKCSESHSQTKAGSFCFTAKHADVVSCKAKDRCFSITTFKTEQTERGAEYGCISEPIYNERLPYLDSSGCIALEAVVKGQEDEDSPAGQGVACFCGEDLCNKLRETVGHLSARKRESSSLGQRSTQAYRLSVLDMVMVVICYPFFLKALHMFFNLA